MHDAPSPKTSKVRVARDPHPPTPRVERASKRALKSSKLDIAKIKKQLLD